MAPPERVIAAAVVLKGAYFIPGNSRRSIWLTVIR
jgi:hypothetical protein